MLIWEVVNNRLEGLAQAKALEPLALEELGALQAFIQDWPNEKFKGLNPEAPEPQLLGWLRGQRQKLQPAGVESLSKQMAEMVDGFQKMAAKMAAQQKIVRVDQVSQCSSGVWGQVVIAFGPKLCLGKVAPCCLPARLRNTPTPTCFEWDPPNKEDDAGNIARFTTHLVRVVLPSGVFAWPVQRVPWISARIECSDGTHVVIASSTSNRTDHILVVEAGKKMLEHWQASKAKLTTSHLEMLLPYMVGLYEAKTSKRLFTDVQQCRRQAALEFLGINAMRNEEHKIVVIMGDGNTHCTVHADVEDPNTIHVTAPAADALPSVPERNPVPANELRTSTPSAITAQFVQRLLTRTRLLTEAYLQRSQSAARGSDAGDATGHSQAEDDARGPSQQPHEQAAPGPTGHLRGGSAGASGSGAAPQHAGASKQRAPAAPDAGLSEAAAENALAQCYRSVLAHGLDLKVGDRLVFTPPTSEKYAASFKFNFDTATDQQQQDATA